MTYALRQQFQDMDRSVQADERQKLADMAATQKRSDEANQRRILSQVAPANFDLAGEYQFGQQDATQPAPQTSTLPTGGGAAYKGRPQAPLRDHAIEISEMSKRMSSMKNARIPDKPGLSASDQALLAHKSRTGSLTPQEQVEFDNIRRMDARGTSTPSAQMNSMEQQLKSWQSEDSARQRGRNPAGPVAQAAGDFISRIRQAESNGNMNAVGPYVPGQGTAKSDMQVMDRTFGDPGYGVRPAQNNSLEERSRVGRDYAQAMLQRYGNEADAAAAYNWGPGNFERWVTSGRNPAQMPAETRNYVAKVTGGAPTQQVAQAPATAPQQQTYSGMGPGGSPQMMQEQIQLATFRYNQLAQLIQHAPPEQQERIGSEMRTLQAGVRAQQAYMLAAQADANPQALAQLVSLSGAQAARTGDGMYVLVDQGGKPLSQPVTGGQLGAYLFQAMDAKSREAKAEMQGKIALEQAKAEAQARGKITEQGGTGAELEHLKGQNAQLLALLNKNYRAQTNPLTGEGMLYHEGTGKTMPLRAPLTPNAVPLD
jgi:hypothetical protein